MKRCRHCGKIPVRITTDGRGHDVTVPEPCACMLRKMAGLCRTCPTPIETTGNRRYCATCAEARRRAVQRRHANERRGVTGPVKSPEWRKEIDEERRLAAVCQLCNKPVAGRPKVALYCARHKKIRLAAAQRKHNAKTGGAGWKRYAERNRETLRRKAREKHRSSKRLRQRKAEYKREWRKRNPEKVKAQKRRHALRGKVAEAMRRRRERLGDLARVHPNPAPRNERGERLCLAGCGTILIGRPKMCGACKEARKNPVSERRQAA